MIYIIVIFMSYSYNLDLSYNNKKSLNILIVDDDTTSSELFKELLELHGHTVKTLDEGVKCLSNCMKNTYDIIFLDYHIGDLDGAELADCLKDVLHSKSIIYAYTGDSDPNIIKKCKDIGMDGAIIKPLNIHNINKILSDIEQKNNKTSIHKVFNIWY
jgi:CheY-like chemotaxis protein